MNDIVIRRRRGILPLPDFCADMVRKETADEDRYCCERRSVQGKP